MTYYYEYKELGNARIRIYRERRICNIPLVSIVIPTIGKRPELLMDAIDSIYKNNYGNFEILVVYGGDNVQNARNIGWDLSNGKYICFLDDDDVFLKGKIQKQVEYMKYNNNCGLCCTGYTSTVNGVKRTKIPVVNSNYTLAINGFCMSTTSAYMIRNDIKEKTGNFDEELVFDHEYDLAIRIAMHGYNIHTIPEILMKQIGHEGNMSLDFIKRIKGQIQMFIRYRKNFSVKRKISVFVLTGLYVCGIVFGKGVINTLHLVESYSQKRYMERFKDYNGMPIGGNI